MAATDGTNLCATVAPVESLPGIGDVHVWLVPLGDLHPSYLGRTPTARRSRRHLVTELVARYLGPHAASTWSIDRSCEHCRHPTHGRPRVRSSRAPDRTLLEISVSHTSAVMGIAVATSAVGLDLEPASSGRRVLDLGRSVLSVKEMAQLSRESTSAARQALAYWTAKEAALKSTGHGIADGVSGVCTAAIIDGGWVPIEWTQRGLPMHRFVHPLPQWFDCVGAVAVAARGQTRLSVSTWCPERSRPE
jgi:4'-phosphopantetheinyl transferase superfamily protein